MNLALAGLVEKIIFVCPQVRVMAFDVGVVADVARARGREREKICAQRAFVGGAIGPEGSARFPILAEAFVMSDGVLDDEVSTRSGWARIMRKPTGPP